MTNFGKLALSLLALPTMLLASSAALAAVPPECGKFITEDGSIADCRVVVSGGCDVECTPLKFQAGCSGGCTVSANATCTNDCGVSCIAQCDPAKLDCVTGCHDECEQPFIADCKANPMHASRDCVEDAKASCTSYCRNQCKVQPSNCTEHCDTCCTGACTATINMDCDISCYAKLEGGCRGQCEAPSGAVFCNDQYVNAADPQKCIDALIAQGIEVDVSARGECTCTLSGCDCDGNASAGGLACAATPGHESPFAPAAVALGMMAAGISVARRKNRKSA
jgi:hypothetical protein